MTGNGIKSKIKPTALVLLQFTPLLKIIGDGVKSARSGHTDLPSLQFDMMGKMLECIKGKVATSRHGNIS